MIITSNPATPFSPTPTTPCAGAGTAATTATTPAAKAPTPTTAAKAPATAVAPSVNTSNDHHTDNRDAGGERRLGYIRVSTREQNEARQVDALN